MWSHYGDFHRGYCIGFDEEKLRNTGFFGKGGKMFQLGEGFLLKVVMSLIVTKSQVLTLLMMTSNKRVFTKHIIKPKIGNMKKSIALQSYTLISRQKNQTD